MSADAYLPVWVRDLSIDLVMTGDHLRPQVVAYVRQGVVRVIAGPTRCHLRIDIRRPYYRPRRETVEALPPPAGEAP